MPIIVKKHYCINSAFYFCLILSNNVRKFLTYHITAIMCYVFIKGFPLSNYVGWYYCAILCNCKKEDVRTVVHVPYLQFICAVKMTRPRLWSICLEVHGGSLDCLETMGNGGFNAIMEFATKGGKNSVCVALWVA